MLPSKVESEIEIVPELQTAPPKAVAPLPPLPPSPPRDTPLAPAPPLPPFPPVARLVKNWQELNVTSPALKIAPPQPAIPLPPPLPLPPIPELLGLPSAPAKPLLPMAALPWNVQLEITALAFVSTKMAPPFVLWPPDRVRPLSVSVAGASTVKS